MTKATIQTDCFEKTYPYERKNMRLQDNDPAWIEGYAHALADIMSRMTGDSVCGKHYDPLLVEGLVMHSYIFDMLDGGRHHEMSGYKKHIALV